MTTASIPGELERQQNHPEPGLVLAWHPPSLVCDDRAHLKRRLVVGRSSKCGLCLRDKALSRTHFSIHPKGPELFSVVDEGSRHGLLVDGKKVLPKEPVDVKPQSVLRAGSCVFVVVHDLWALAPADREVADLAMAGQFYAAVLADKVRLAARTGYDVLLEGESGTGKELAAQMLHDNARLLGRAGAFVTHNGALFAGPDDAVATLFGVGSGGFTGVEPRAGALELAHQGTLFLDEVHALPARVQQALLRFVEEGLVQPLGKRVDSKKRVDVRLVCGTNRAVDHATRNGQLAHDFVARLFRVELPPLRDRKADIPSIFQRIVEVAAPDRESGASLWEAVDVAFIEALMCHDYSAGNVRELQKLAALAFASLAEGLSGRQALERALAEVIVSPDPVAATPSDPDGTVYSAHQEAILAAFEKAGGNLSRMVKVLAEQDITCTRQGLARALERWGARPIPRRKP